MNGGRQLRVPQHVLVPEHNVVGGERVAVGPAHAAPQPEGKGAPAVADLPIARQVGAEFRSHRVPAKEPVIGHAGVEYPDILRAGSVPLQGPAIGPVPFRRHDDERILREPLLHRREAAVRHPRIPVGRLLKLAPPFSRPFRHPVERFGRKDIARWRGERLRPGKRLPVRPAEQQCQQAEHLHGEKEEQKDGGEGKDEFDRGAHVTTLWYRQPAKEWEEALTLPGPRRVPVLVTEIEAITQPLQGVPEFTLRHPFLPQLLTERSLQYLGQLFHGKRQKMRLSLFLQKHKLVKCPNRSFRNLTS